jgi:predicted amidohydrolase
MLYGEVILKNNMRIGFCQFNVVHSNIEANLKKIADLLKNVEADLIVLPELCFSGYSFLSKNSVFPFADNSAQKEILNRLSIIAKTKGIYLIAGMAEKEGNKLYNSAIVIGPEGYIGKHRKINLSKNEMIFDRGKSLEIFKIGNVKIGIAICFESWFPESMRILTLRGAQIICCPMNFGGPWTPDVIKVRSLENKVFTIMANRIGKEQIDSEEAEFRGESQIVDHGGNVLAKVAKEECVKTVDINPEEAKKKDNIVCEDMRYEMGLYKEHVKYSL